MKILYSEEAIAERVAAMGKEITEFYYGKPLTVVVLMMGALPFAADLIRKIGLPLHVDTLGASSYVNDVSSKNLNICFPLRHSPAGRHLLILDDVFDTGFTMQQICKYLTGRGALSVRSCVLINKMVHYDRECTPDWTGFTALDQYLIGYGMDSREEYRNLPYIAIKEEGD